MNKIIRTHDEFYLKENRYKKTKQLFEDVIEMVKKVTIPEKRNGYFRPWLCRRGISICASG